MRDTDACVDLKNKIIRAVRTGTGMHEHLALPIADEILGLLQTEFGGSRVYIPSATKRMINERNKRVMAAFTGDNHDQVCRDNGITRSTLYRILNRA